MHPIRTPLLLIVTLGLTTGSSFAIPFGYPCTISTVELTVPDGGSTVALLGLALAALAGWKKYSKR